MYIILNCIYTLKNKPIYPPLTFKDGFFMILHKYISIDFIKNIICQNILGYTYLYILICTLLVALHHFLTY